MDIESQYQRTVPKSGIVVDAGGRGRDRGDTTTQQPQLRSTHIATPPARPPCFGAALLHDGGAAGELRCGRLRLELLLVLVFPLAQC